MNCSLCDKTLEYMNPLGNLFSPRASVIGIGSSNDYDMWKAQVCPKCKLIFCGNCLELGKPTPCPICGKPTEPAFQSTINAMDGVRKLKETDILKAKKKLARQAKASYEQYMKGIEERIKGIEERNQTIRVEEEKHQQAKKVEDERRSRVQTLRKSSGQCVICGQKLGLFPKLLGSDRHSKCKVFRD